MYLTGSRRMNGMGLAITMPSIALRNGTAIRSFPLAPIVSVNRPVVNTPTAPLPQPTAPIVRAPIAAAPIVTLPKPVVSIPAPIPTLMQPPVDQPSPSIYWGGNPPRYIPPILPAPRPAPAPTPVLPPTVNANAGTPVPAGYPTSQIFVNTDGSFWQYSSAQSRWINMGTPYNTGATATPAAPPPSSSGASTAAPASTTAPAPVSVSVSPSTSSSYQEILDWLQEDTLLSSIGFAGIPNWIAAFGGALLLYKVSSGSGGRR